MVGTHSFNSYLAPNPDWAHCYCSSRSSLESPLIWLHTLSSIQTVTSKVTKNNSLTAKSKGHSPSHPPIIWSCCQLFLNKHVFVLVSLLLQPPESSLTALLPCLICRCTFWVYKHTSFGDFPDSHFTSLLQHLAMLTRWVPVPPTRYLLPESSHTPSHSSNHIYTTVVFWNSTRTPCSIKPSTSHILPN